MTHATASAIGTASSRAPQGGRGDRPLGYWPAETGSGQDNASYLSDCADR